MTRVWRVVVPGPPIGKPRMTRSDKWKRRDCVVKYRNWADLLRHAIRTQQHGFVPDAMSVVRLSMYAFFEPPESTSKKKRAAMIGEFHRVKPDADNILKTIDAFYKDDQAIPSVSCDKRWDHESRLVIEIEYEPSLQRRS